MDKRFVVVAECIDKRTGKRYFPGQEFNPAPTAKQARALIGAECIEEIDAASPPLPTDGLDLSSDVGLADTAKAENVDIAAAKSRDEIIALIRAARETAVTDLAKLDHDALVAKAKGLGIDVDANAADDQLREAILAKLIG